MSSIRTSPGQLCTASENDICNLDSDTILDFAPKRQKRSRNKEDDLSESSSFKAELMAMLSNWKKDQDLMMKKLCSDIAELKQQNAHIQTTNDELEKAVKFMSLQYEDIKEKLLTMERERRKMLII